MSSFGEALVGAFNQTYGTISSARLRNAQAAALEDEIQANRQQRQDVRDSQVRNGILNPDGTTNDPGAAAPAPTMQAPQAAPMEVTRQQLGQATSPAPAPTPSPMASPPPAAPAPAPATGAQPMLTPAGRQAAAAGAQAAQAAPQAPVAAGAAAGAATQGAPAPAQGNMPAAPPQGQPQGTQPPVPREQVEEAARIVERDGNNPADAMVVAGAMAPPPQRGPGGQGTAAQAAQYAQPLVQEIMQHRGQGEQGPLTRANWNAYLRDVTLAAQRNLSPQQQVQALAVVDRIRTSGLQRFTALAVAAAQAGDMQGAANALNGASNFNPDGFQDQFRATGNGVEMVRRPEAGERGQETRVTVGANDIVRYATAMLDPSWSLTHFLNVRRQDETERHNRTSEGLQAASIAESRANRAEARNARQEAARGGASYVAATADLEDAIDAERRLGANATAEERRAASARVEEARTARRAAAQAAVAAGGVTGLQVGQSIETAGERRRAAADEATARRGQLTEGQQRRFDTAETEYRDNTAPARGGQRSDEQRFALDHALPTQMLNRDMSTRQILENLESFRRDPTQFQINRGENAIRPRGGGPVMRLPPGVLQAPQQSGSSLPGAPQDQGSGSLGGARTPPNPGPTLSAPPAPATGGGRAGTPEMNAAEQRALTYQQNNRPPRTSTPRRLGRTPLTDAADDARALIQSGVAREAAIADALRAPGVRGRVTREQLERALTQ